MAAEHDEFRELPPPTPAPPELCVRATRFWAGSGISPARSLRAEITLS